jgi:hypothetical protein
MKTAEVSPKVQGWWKGDPLSPGGVKFKTSFQDMPIHVDRPKGFVMTGTDSDGKSWSRKYKYDYGFIPRTKGGDGDGLDVFIGPNKKAPEAYWAIQTKKDGSFDEYKVFLGFDNRDVALAVYRDHIPKKLLGGMVTMRVDMMKALMGMNAEGYGSLGVKTAAVVVGLFDEFEKISEVNQDIVDFVQKNLSRKALEHKVLEAAHSIKAGVKDRLQ